jgi:retron-type reverse transcriptase
VAQAQQYIAEGHGWCVDLAPEKFFDRVNHDKLTGRIAKRVGDRSFIETHSGVLERRGHEKWIGQFERRR